MLDAVTLDQLRMLAAIADTGSFTAAAKKLQRAQSAVSHGIATLENELRLELFDRTEKKPKLTEAGSAVLADARLTLTRIGQLKARAASLASGVESEIKLAVTVLAPLQPVIDLLDEFRNVFPSVAIELFIEEIGGSAILVHERVCQLGISGTPSLRAVPAGDLMTIPIGSIEIVAVAKPDHSLALLNRALTQDDLNEHRQLVPTSRARLLYPNTLAREVWRISDLLTRRDMLMRGIGWGTFPHHIVAKELSSGALVELNLANRPPEFMKADLFMIHRLDVELGKAGTWLIDQLKMR